MRKFLLLLAVVGAVTGTVLLFHNNSQAQIPQFNRVDGYTYLEGGKQGSLVVQASSDNGTNWHNVATSNGSGYYYWEPSSGTWPDGWIKMQLKRTCYSGIPTEVDPIEPRPSWLFYSQATACARCTVYSQYCP